MRTINYYGFRTPKDTHYPRFIGIRITPIVAQAINKLLEEYPEDYRSMSDVVRAAIIKLAREKVRSPLFLDDGATNENAEY